MINNELKALFESSVLNDETKEALTEAFTTAVEAEKVKLEESYNAKLAEATKELSDEAVKMIEEAINDELSVISEEIVAARTLEVDMAEKLELFKESYAQKTDELVQTLVAESVAEEIEELREGIEQANKVQFAVELVESFGNTYKQLFAGEDAVDLTTQLKEARAELDSIKRTAKLNELLECLSGTKRKVAETVLESVSLDKLEDKFEAIKPLLLAESKEEKEQPLEESATQEEVNIDDKTVVIEESQDEEVEQLTESQKRAQARLLKSINFGKNKV